MYMVLKKKMGQFCLSVSYPKGVFWHALALNNKQILFNLSVRPNLELLMFVQIKVSICDLLNELKKGLEAFP